MKKGIDFIGVAVVYFCHDGKGNILLAKRSQKSRDEQGRWDVGGGGVEFGETVEQTLVKEIKEEYNADVLSFEFLGFRDVHRIHDGRPTHWVALDYKVLVSPENVKIGEPEKFEDLGWFKINFLPTPVHSQLPNFLAKYRESLQNG